jgi:hypothetical protein
MAALARGERLQIMLTDEELAALDDWRFDKRMPSRASAVRELLKRGLAAEGVVVGGLRSRDFGVLDPAEKTFKTHRRTRREAKQGGNHLMRSFKPT